jgi:hypothetical protein
MVFLHDILYLDLAAKILYACLASPCKATTYISWSSVLSLFINTKFINELILTSDKNKLNKISK